MVISSGFGPGPRSNRYRQCVDDDEDDDDDDEDDDDDGNDNDPDNDDDDYDDDDDDDDEYDDDDDDDDDDGLRWSVETVTKGRLWRMSAAHLILSLLSRKYPFRKYSKIYEGIISMYNVCLPPI